MPTKSDTHSASPARPDPNKHLPLAELLPGMKMLNRESAILERLNHRRVFGAVLDGMIPAERINGRWYVNKADLPKIAELLGVMPAAKSGRSRKDASSPSNQEAVAAA